MAKLPMTLLLKIGQEIQELISQEALYVKQDNGGMILMMDYLKIKYPEDFKEKED